MTCFRIDQTPISRLRPEELARLWDAHTSAPTDETRNLLTQHYSYVAYGCAKGFAKRTPVDINDLYQDGIQGILAALEKFDPKRGYKFITFAGHKVRSAILDGIRERDSQTTPRLVRARIKKLATVTERLEQRLARPPTREEISCVLRKSGLSKAMAGLTLQDGELRGMLNLEKTFFTNKDGNDIKLKDLIVVPGGDPGRDIELRDLAEKVLRGCSEQERVILMGVCDGKTMKGLGKGLGLSQSRVSQIRSKVLARLREDFKGCDSD